MHSRLTLISRALLDDVVRAVEEDHADLKRFIAIMKDETETPESIAEAAESFVSLLKSHSASEETALYVPCLKVDALRRLASEGMVEHRLANHLVKTMPSKRQAGGWLAQVKVLAETVAHHIREEEEEFLPEVRRHFAREKQARMAHEFLALRRRSQRGYSFDNAGALRSASA